MERRRAHRLDEDGLDLYEVDLGHVLGEDRAERDARAEADDERAPRLLAGHEAGEVPQEKLRPHVLGARPGVHLAVDLQVEAPARVRAGDEHRAREALAVDERLVARGAARDAPGETVEIGARVQAQRLPAREERRGARRHDREREDEVPGSLALAREREDARGDGREHGARGERAADPDPGDQERSEERAEDRSERVRGVSGPGGGASRDEREGRPEEPGRDRDEGEGEGELRERVEREARGRLVDRGDEVDGGPVHERDDSERGDRGERDQDSEDLEGVHELLGARRGALRADRVAEDVGREHDREGVGRGPEDDREGARPCELEGHRRGARQGEAEEGEARAPGLLGGWLLGGGEAAAERDRGGSDGEASEGGERVRGGDSEARDEDEPGEERSEDGAERVRRVEGAGLAASRQDGERRSHERRRHDEDEAAEEGAHDVKGK